MLGEYNINLWENGACVKIKRKKWYAVVQGEKYCNTKRCLLILVYNSYAFFSEANIQICMWPTCMCPNSVVDDGFAHKINLFRWLHFSTLQLLI